MPGTAVVSNFQSGDISLAGMLPGDKNGVANGPDGNLTIQSSIGAPGGTATVVIDGDGNIKALAGLNLTLQFDPTLTVTQNDVTVGSMMSAPQLAANTTIPGKLTIALASTKNASGPGVIARVNFHIPQGVKLGTTFPVFVASVTANDQTPAPLTLGYQSGTITVNSRLPGDVNGDGVVNALDATLALQIVAGIVIPTPDQRVGADIDGDGSIDVRDVILILDKAVGL